MVGGNFICLREKWYIIYLFINYKIVYLVYRDFWCLLLKGVQVYHVPPSLSYRKNFILSARSACGRWWSWVGVCVGLGCRRGWVGNVIPGVITWIGLALRHPLTVAAAHWSSSPEPGTSVCSGGWRTPKCSQSYSWCIHMSFSRAASTWWQCDWLTS